ncbi:NAC domain-containing protein 40-like isoform X5 [Panicum hallii]|uniref:NAC domain-containing protein 40-like isoform X5 n=1 Tax=Panicum hallii TaxID=206008 RepID=UPI000DF4E749|nr:NAC domain-containing protein 40-like isoform X5 [Panicum hallii]
MPRVRQYLGLQSLFPFLSKQEYLRISEAGTLLIIVVSSLTTMCPPNPELKLAALNISIRDSWSDEELVRFLAERKAEDPLPQDVLVGLDFSLVDPRIFTVDLWYLCWSDDQQPNNSAENSIRKAKNGYWKHVESCKVPTSIGIMGMKIILQFYEGHAPCGKRTGWVMHEYQVEQNDEANLPQVTADANEEDVCSSKVQFEQKPLSALDDIDVIATGDYIELNDLLTSEASASTSENSSKRSMVSEDYFDSDAFLREILKGSNTTDGLNQDHKFSIAAPTKSANVVLSPSEQGSMVLLLSCNLRGLVQFHDNNGMVPGTSHQKPVPEGDRGEHSRQGFQQQGPSMSSYFPSSHVKPSHSNSSSSSQSSMKSHKEQSTSKFGMIGKKYCCFGSF